MAGSTFSPDDEDPSAIDDQYYGPAAQLLPQGTQAPQVQTAPPPQQGQQGQIPQYIAAPDAPQTAPPPQSAAPQQAAPAPKIMFPTAPEAPADDHPAYQALADKTKADYAMPKVAPKWWERLAGAAVGFGVGYKDGPSEGIREGSAVTGRGQTAALADQQSRLAADQVDRDAWQKSHDLNTQGYEQKMQQFGKNMEIANGQQTQANEDRLQGNADRNFNRDTANDSRNQSNSNRSFDYEGQVHADMLNHQKVTDSNENRRIGIEAQREAREGRDKGSGTKTTVTPAGFQAVLSTRDKEYAAENKTYAADRQAADGPAEVASVEQNHQKALNDLQDRWNQRLATADPEGKYAPKGSGQQQQQPISQAQAPQSIAAPLVRTVRDSKGNSVQAIVKNGAWVNQKTGKPL